MKFSLLVAVVASATLTQVGASPLRVVVVTSNLQESSVPQKYRFGHALADSHVAKLALPDPSVNVQPVRRPCGTRIKDKAIEISNAFRHALGLPTIETTHPQPGGHVHGGMVHILPFVGTPNTFIGAPPRPDDNQIKTATLAHPHRHFHNEAQRIRRMGNTFWMRVHKALMILGPWEGRAVAFVFGCGIGVLIRMFWVLTVIMYRSIRGERDDEYTPVAVFEVDAEDIAVPPPTYTLADEKDQIKAKDAIEN